MSVLKSLCKFVTHFQRLRNNSSRKNFIIRSFNTSPVHHKSLEDSPNAELDKNVYDRYMCLPQPEAKIQVQYIWIDMSGENLRSKTRTIDFIPTSYKDLPNWTFDGSSLGFGTVALSDCYLIPVALYPDPIGRGNNKLVLCETFTADKKVTKTNHRQACVESLNRACDHEVMFGFEQEYILTGPDGRPFGWPVGGSPDHLNVQYLCGVGAQYALGREISECFYRCCLYCGIDIHGTNSEVLLSQWEFQTGPTLSIKAGDDLWVARYLIMRIAEDFGVGISLNPKLMPNMSGSGMHTNISSKRTRGENGLKYIEEAIKKLEKKHKEHIKVYDPRGGDYNIHRLVGMFETADISKFSYGVSNRECSVRIPVMNAEKKSGYFEDRRPAANADPYQVINAIVKTCFL